jgi:dTDP-4-amino-4,6-dideoxygalactose transaminase
MQDCIHGVHWPETTDGPTADGAARRYDRGLAKCRLGLPTERPDCMHSYRNDVVRAQNRDQHLAALAEAGIATTLPYVPPSAETGLRTATRTQRR